MRDIDAKMNAKEINIGRMRKIRCADYAKKKRRI